MKKTNTRGPQPTNFYSWVRRRIVREEAALFVLTIDGKERKVRVARSGKGIASVRPLVRTIEQLRPELVEAHNADGEVLGVWEMPENVEPEEPGYAPEPSDTENQRDLKVVAHLIADAYKHSIEGMERVIRIQSDTFTNERKHINAATASIERIIGKLARTKFRVESAADAAAAAGADVEDPDEWLREFVGNIVLQRMGVPRGMANGAHDVDETEPEPPGETEA